VGLFRVDIIHERENEQIHTTIFKFIISIPNRILPTQSYNWCKIWRGRIISSNIYKSI